MLGCDTLAETKMKNTIRLKNVAPRTAIRAGPRFFAVSANVLNLQVSPPILVIIHSAWLLRRGTSYDI